MSIFSLRKRRRDAGRNKLRQHLQEHGVFDAAWYLENYPEVSAYEPGPLAHFCDHGFKEGRAPAAWLDAAGLLESKAFSDFPEFESYLKERSDPTNAKIYTDPTNVRAIIERSQLFDAKWYRERYPDIARTRIDPFTHYVEVGLREKRQPSPQFDPVFYAERYPDYADAFGTPIEHFIRVGRKLGLEAVDPDWYAKWLHDYDRLSEADIRAIREDIRTTPLPAVHVVCFVSETGPRTAADVLANLDANLLRPATATFVATGGQLPVLGPRESRIDVATVDPAGAAAIARSWPAGDIVVLLAGAAILQPHALYAFARRMIAGRVRAAYSDHDRLHGDVRHSAAFKPSFSPLLQAQTAYIGPLVAFRVDEAVAAALSSGLASAEARFDAVASQGLAAMAAEDVVRLPFLLSHLLAGRAPDDAAPRVNRLSDAFAPIRPVDLSGAGQPSIAIVIPIKDKVALLRTCIESILAKTRYDLGKVRFVIVDNGSQEDETRAYLETLQGEHGATVVAYPGRFNFAKLNNLAAAVCTAEVLVFLNNDTSVIDPDWLGKLAHGASDPRYGIVGGKLLYPDDTIQHGGVVLGIQGVAAHRSVGVPLGEDRSDATREMGCLTGACIAIRSALFRELGGFDERLAVAFNDVKLCVRSLEAGYRNLYIVDPLLHHHESKSRGHDVTPEQVQRNLREAAYVAKDYKRYFRDDPSYNVNLSLDRIDEIAFPPRILRPWRRPSQAQSVLMLSSTLKTGYGVPVAMVQYARALTEAGYDVVIGGPKDENSFDFPGCRTRDVRDVPQAARLVATEGLDCVIAHTPPFYDLARYVSGQVLFYAVDYGEPNPEFFADRLERESIDRDKRMANNFADRVFTISQAIYDQQYRGDAIVARIGNGHLAQWNADWAARRAALRDKFGFADKFVVLNVCRFQADERNYKGIDRYIDLCNELPLAYPGIADEIVFVICGRGSEADRAFVESVGLTVFANVSDREMIELYAAADLYVNLSKWEGYNLGIAQALAMGMTAIASDIPAHREFPIETGGTVVELGRKVFAAYEAARRVEPERRPFIEPWDNTTSILLRNLEADLAARPDRWAF